MQLTHSLEEAMENSLLTALLEEQDDHDSDFEFALESALDLDEQDFADLMNDVDDEFEDDDEDDIDEDDDAAFEAYQIRGLDSFSMSPATESTEYEESYDNMDLEELLNQIDV